ncbi:hypothetical protein K1T71_014928 [Dendrolimus kikuchii]|nr:hypothetical protein K1T71_014928 [Dendrolimus kikuchii]
MEVSACRLAMTGHQPLVIVSAYLACQKTLIKKDLETLFNLGPAVIIAGDLNCKHEQWNCNTTNPNGRKEDAEAIRQDISSVLRRSRLPKPNLTRAEYIALKNIRNKPEITVLRADKGNATVVMDTSDYNSKIQDLLSDESTYKKVKTDPTDKVTKQTIAVMKKHSEIKLRRIRTHTILRQSA